MAKEVHSVSEEGYSTTNQIRDFETTVDATGEEAPDTLEALLAAYASCYVPALRVGAEQRDAGDLGRIEIDATGDLNDDDKLESVSFDVTTDADVDDDKKEAIIERADELCKVGDAVKGDLKAEVSIR
ncbi:MULTISPECIES: OsmC family protein [Halostella]|uniref:OsmC family protein n=1 Tax=Halostella TaxID=1843185 RepID=UPI0010800E76|nr:MULTISPECIES: OsmC family protein [Halostella]